MAMRSVGLILSISLLAFAFSDRAQACGAWDIGCEAREIARAPGAKLGEGARNLQREWDKSRTDLSNGLNRIDPRITQFGRDIDAARLKFQSEVFTGNLLEQWIIASRNNAINGAMPYAASSAAGSAILVPASPLGPYALDDRHRRRFECRQSKLQLRSCAGDHAN
jgi:hypothetical protein